MNYKELIQELGRYNLCTYFILPMVGLTEKSFGSIVINTFLTHDFSIVVQVPSLSLIAKTCLLKADHGWTDDNGGYLQYYIEREWWPDVALFIKGKYSKMSAEAKAIINERSGLAYRAETDRGLSTDIRLRALEGEDAVRTYWESELNCKIDPNQELLGIPPVTSFITVKHM